MPSSSTAASLRRYLLLPAIAFLLVLLPETIMSATSSSTPERAEDTQPMKPDATMPDTAVATLEGHKKLLSEVLGAKPAVLVFYRGGWCPYCNTQLSGLRKIIGDLNDLGVQLIAVSPDSPESLKAGLEKTPVEYQLLSDSSAELIQALGIAFKVDEATREKYQGYGIDLEKASGGQDHFLLPVPSVYMVDANRIIRFQHSDPDYKVRLEEGAVLAAAKQMMQSQP